MNSSEQVAFEKHLRLLLETDTLSAAEKFVRAAIEQWGTEDLRRAYSRPLERLEIGNWVSIGVDIDEPKRSLPPEERDKDWQAVFIALNNDSSDCRPRAKVFFGLDAIPKTPNSISKPAYMSEDRFADWLREAETRQFLPEGQRYPAHTDGTHLPILGLDDLHAVQRRRPEKGETREGEMLRLKQQTLAAAAILLRFNQLVEQYGIIPGLPRKLALFTYVARVQRPIEQGISEYGFEAIRQHAASYEHFPHREAARIAESRATERRITYFTDTQRIICELQELRQALNLWPLWHSPLKRMRFAAYVRHDRKLRITALEGIHSIALKGLPDQEFYKQIAVARHGEEYKIAMQPLPLDDRSDLHLLMMTYAKRFGGHAIQSAFSRQREAEIKAFESWFDR